MMALYFIFGIDLAEIGLDLFFGGRGDDGDDLVVLKEFRVSCWGNEVASPEDHGENC